MSLSVVATPTVPKMYHYCLITSKNCLNCSNCQITLKLSGKKWVGLICPVCSVKIVKLTPKLPNTSKLSNYTKIVKLTQIWINWQITPQLLNYHKIVKNLNWRWITAKNLNWPHLDLRGIKSLCCHIDELQVMGHMWANGWFLDSYLTSKYFGTYIGRTCSHQRLEHHLTSSTPDRIVVVRQMIVLGMCRATSFRWLSGTDGLFKMGVNKVTKTKHKNKFMWSIKHQLTRSKCLPKLYSLAFHHSFFAIL